MHTALVVKIIFKLHGLTVGRRECKVLCPFPLGITNGRAFIYLIWCAEMMAQMMMSWSKRFLEPIVTAKSLYFEW